MEDFNQPITERIKLLERLHEQIGTVAPHFWAACQICDLGALEEISQQKFRFLQPLPSQTSQMVRHCKSNSPVPLL